MFWIKLQNNLYIAFSVSVKLLEKDKVEVPKCQLFFFLLLTQSQCCQEGDKLATCLNASGDAQHLLWTYILKQHLKHL